MRLFGTLEFRPFFAKKEEGKGMVDLHGLSSSGGDDDAKTAKILLISAL